MESFSWHLKKEKNSTPYFNGASCWTAIPCRNYSPAFFAVSELAFSYVEELPLLP